MGLIRCAIGRYDNSKGEPTVGATEFAELFAITARVARELEEIAMLDSWVLRPAGGSPGTGDLQVSINESAAIVVADVETFERYLQVQLTTWYPDLEPGPNRR